MLIIGFWHYPTCALVLIPNISNYYLSYGTQIMDKRSFLFGQPWKTWRTEKQAIDGWWKLSYFKADLTRLLLPRAQRTAIATKYPPFCNSSFVSTHSPSSFIAIWFTLEQLTPSRMMILSWDNVHSSSANTTFNENVIKFLLLNQHSINDASKEKSTSLDSSMNDIVDELSRSLS